MEYTVGEQQKLINQTRKKRTTTEQLLKMQARK